MPIINLSTKRADLKPGEGTANMKHATLDKPVSGRFSRRQVLKMAGGLGLAAAGMGLLDACSPRPTAPSTAGGTLETTTIRIPVGNTIPICIAPLYMAEPFLRAEGFTNVQYVASATPTLTVDAVASGAGDMSLQFSGPDITYVDAGKPVLMLAGIHIGCFVLFGTSAITNVGDLKGKTISISQIGGADYVFMASILANVGLDPNTDVGWRPVPAVQTKQEFIDGKIDAILAFPPHAQELMDLQVGHVVVNSMMDKPWSQYYCCMATFNRDFVQTKPVATKRALRALLNATDATALHPDQAARLLLNKKIAPVYKYALEAMQEIPYNRWRVYNPEDTTRFYSLLLNGVGMIKSTPDQIIKVGTDWRFLSELKSELPATPAPQGAFAATRSLLCKVDDHPTVGERRARSAD
jgi:NitT/TauT family transport system substrate-binding protein